jgi:hypothetical protein
MFFSGLPGSADIIIAGGGITGAGIFRDLEPFLLNRRTLHGEHPASLPSLFMVD